MKLLDRELIKGTRITIGRRVYYRQDRQKISSRYAAEFRDASGRQHCRNLGTTNRAHARNLALKLQKQIDAGSDWNRPRKISITKIVEDYLAEIKIKGLAPKTYDKYRTDLEKLQHFCQEHQLYWARNFKAAGLYQYRQWLEEQNYQNKTIYGALVIAKQMFKWGWRQGLLPDYNLGAAVFPKAKAKPQPCFTTGQVESLIEKAIDEEKLAFALMGYAGLRIGEVEQLQGIDLIKKSQQFTMIHIRRGGSNGTTKDRDERFVPVHPRIAELLRTQKSTAGVLVPHITERKLLQRLKKLCLECGFENPKQYKLHTFRHHFASLCANHGVAYRKALAWLGHSSSEILDLYYHLYDEDSQQTMKALALSTTPEGSHRNPNPPTENKCPTSSEPL